MTLVSGRPRSYAPPAMNKYYSRAAIDHFLHPRNARVMDAPSGVGVAVNKADDTVTFYVRLEGGAVTEASFQAQGCAATIATASIATETLRGLSVAEARALTVEHLADALGGLPAFKVERALVTVSALGAALDDATK